MTVKFPADFKPKIRINMISESEFTVQGHGVHTAYKELTEALRARNDVDIDVNTNRPADIVHIQTVGLYALGRLLRRNGRKVVSAHLVPDSFIGSFVGARHWRMLARWWLRFFYGRADLVLACSGMVRDELVRDMKLQNVELLYNTVDMARYNISENDRAAARRKLDIDRDEFVVLGNGQIQPRKRLDTFIAMAQALPDVKFFWVGGMPFKQLGADYVNMQRLINSVPRNVIMTGLVSLEEVRTYYAVADVFVLPAVQENHPMSVLEAAGAGLPIILRDIPQYDDTFRGNVLMAEDDNDFKKYLEQLRHDKTLREEYVKRSGAIAKRFDSATGAARLVDFYNSLRDEV